MENSTWDRSWNDPPKLNYSDTKESGAKRRILNKRIAFPINEQEKQLQPPGNSLDINPIGKEDLTEFKTSTIATKSFFDESTSAVPDLIENEISEEKMFLYIIDAFEKVMNENSTVFEKKFQDDINHRINVLKKSWKDKLSLNVKKMMFELGKELSNGNVDAAHKIHCSLMVDHVREVRQWMVGVKHIIHMSRQKSMSENQSTEDSTSNSHENIHSFQPISLDTTVDS